MLLARHHACLPLALVALALVSTTVRGAQAPVTIPATAPATSVVAAAKTPEAPSGTFPLSNYRIFVESTTFSGTDPGYRDAEYLFKLQQKSSETWTAPQPILLGPGYKAKDLPLKSRKPVAYGLTYYFPLQLTDSQQPKIEGELTLNSYAGGLLLPTRKFSESFHLAIERNQVGKTIEVKGDRGSTVRIKLMSVCDFSIYETIDLASIRKPLRADLEASGARVFDERGDRSLYSRPTNAIWIGGKAPEECMLMAIRTFSVKYGIPVKGIFAMSDGHHGKWYFNPYGVTLGYSPEIETRPELSRAIITDLAKPGAKSRLQQLENAAAVAPVAPPTAPAKS